jgi:tRNA(Ile)-lysidine synthase
MSVDTLKKQAIGAEEFAGLLQAFDPIKKMAVAVSGGPDSMALAFCLKRYQKTDVLAFIVDHNLRKGSSSEAEGVQKSLSEMGISAEILRWDHEPIITSVHEHARKARYHLLTKACHTHGIQDLFLAHHQDDQAETILMRMAKGSNIEGLSGMSSQTMREGIRLLRPFLSLRKDRLIVTCQEAGLSYVSDPSNTSDLFARGRLRKIMPLLAEEGLSIESLVRLGNHAAEVRQALDVAVRDFLIKFARSEIGGYVRIDRTALGSIPRAIGLRALASSLRFVHDHDYPPEQDGLAGFFDTILGATEDTARTFYGCIASVSENRVSILREPSAATDISPLNPQESVLWDNRWLVSADPLTKPSLIRALGNPSHEIVDLLAPKLRHQVPQGRVRASLPSIWIEGELHAIPSFEEKDGFHMVYRKRAFP